MSMAHDSGRSRTRAPSSGHYNGKYLSGQLTMELRQLRYFIAIVEHGGFSRAASELGRTQQALSKAIHALEEELGVRLLDRNSQIATPTAFGKLLLEHGRAIESETPP